ncbi:outer membrane lipoprotein-sorting protein [Fulvivirga sp. 29W222]|uniref:Outer membrane lipoprotein-sorting protein n=2 Tax=Fulvivirga marina TaxID=2494733 RepID=A0A937KGB7_9BACT|nr:outer membrane lipoprotein-sorting protein [Fulvivirga marina]
MAKLKILLVFLCLLNLEAQCQDNLDATALVKKADERMRGQSNLAEMTMEIIRPDWSRTMSMKSWSKGTKYALVLIQAPAKDKGTVSLKIDNEMWNWLPSIERSIKISPSMMMQSWMGSDFTNDDLIKQSSIVNDYKHKILKEEIIQGEPCYKIELIPKPDAPVVWGKILMWISKDLNNQLKVEYYDEGQELVNVMTGYDLKTLDGRLVPTRWEMVPVDEEGKKTVLTYKDIDFDIDIRDSFFSKQNMNRVR